MKCAIAHEPADDNAEVVLLDSYKIFKKIGTLPMGKECAPCGPIREQAEKQQRETEHVHSREVGSQS